jgi:hypothetical protein
VSYRFGGLLCPLDRSQGGNRFEELAPVPGAGEANVLDIVRSQLGQDFGVNLVLRNASS